MAGTDAQCDEVVAKLSQKVASHGANHSSECGPKATAAAANYTANATNMVPPPLNAAGKPACHKLHCTQMLAHINNSATTAGDEPTKQCLSHVANKVQSLCACLSKQEEITSITKGVAEQLHPDCLAKASVWYVEYEGQPMNASQPAPAGKCHQPWCDGANQFLETKKAASANVPADVSCVTSVQTALNAECDKPDGTQ